MAPVALPVQAAGGHAHVEVGAVLGDGLQQVEDVEGEDPAGLVVVGDLDVEAPPQLVPAHLVLAKQLFERGGVPCVPAGGLREFGDRVVARGRQRHDLLDGERPAPLDLRRDLCAT